MLEIIYTLVVTHITICAVTLYLHRSQAHRSVEFRPIINHFFRLWLWLTTGMVTKEWVAIHRKHHRYSDVVGDPHSPQIFGIWSILFGGAFKYAEASRNRPMIQQYGIGTPDDWIERNIYSKYPNLGIWITLLFNLCVFGLWGLLIWGIQMIWIPFWAAGVINGVGHWLGYKNGITRDSSRNIVSWGIIIGGEELHNNHHLDPASPKLSLRWFEFDIGWFYICTLELFRLAKIRRLDPIEA